MELWVVQDEDQFYAFTLEAAALTVAEAYGTDVTQATWVDCLGGYAKVLSAVA